MIDTARGNDTDTSGNIAREYLYSRKDTNSYTFITEKIHPIHRKFHSIPENNSKDILIDTIVTINFNKTMNITSVAKAISITPFTMYNLIWLNNSTVLNIQFRENLSYNTTYLIVIGGNSTDFSGNPLIDPFILTFTTEKYTDTSGDDDDIGNDDISDDDDIGNDDISGDDDLDENDKSDKKDYTITVLVAGIIIVLIVIIIVVVISVFRRKSKRLKGETEKEESVIEEEEIGKGIEKNGKKDDREVENQEEEEEGEDEEIEGWIEENDEEDEEEGEYECPDCGATLLAEDNMCSSCGVEFEEDVLEEDEIQSDEAEIEFEMEEEVDNIEEETEIISKVAEEDINKDSLENEVKKPFISFKLKLSSPELKKVRPSTRKIIPNYYITHKIGSGGFATVYRALDEDRKEVAIKLPKFLDETIGTSVLEQFKAEAEMWEKLKHNNIVNFFNSDIRPVPYMVIELMDGGNLKELMEKHRFSVGEALDIIQHVLDGVAYAHRMASVHRDIKPENILFNKNGVPKISDWGIGKFMASEGASKSIGVKGTLSYSAPEQISKKKFGGVDWSTDVFQLGIVFYEMLTGSHPFHDEDPAGIIGNILNEEPEAPSVLDSQIPKFLDEIVLKALSKNKKDRWRSADIMYDRLAVAIDKKKKNARKYKRSLQRALRDGIISEDEEVMLSELREHFGIMKYEHEELIKELLAK